MFISKKARLCMSDWVAYSYNKSKSVIEKKEMQKI